MGRAQRAAEAQRRDRSRVRVVIATLHPGHVDGEFFDSVCQTLLAETRPDGLTGVGGGYIGVRSGPRIAEARSQIVEAFLNADIYRSAEWLFMVDSDMTFEPTALRRLVETADKDTHPIVGGLCFAGSSPDNAYPTLYQLVPHEGTWDTRVVRDYPRDALVKVGATGAAALLVHRSVLTTMYRAFEFLPDGTRNNYPWFVEGHVDSRGRPLGEDVAFCIRAQGLGIPVHVHTGIEFGHRKQVTLNAAVFDAQRLALKDAS